MSEPSFTLNGVTVAFETGDTIMDAALRCGVYIPHLCHHPGLAPHGSCRICVVEANGRRVSACTHPAVAGQRVDSETEALRECRRSLLQMLFVEGNHVCPGCEKSGACTLQALAYQAGMLAPGYRHFYPRRELDASHPAFVIDHGRCVLCGLCVRASRDMDRKAVFSIQGRGHRARLRVNSPSGRLGDSEFTATDRAADICPVGAILPKHQGYDTPIGERLYDRRPIEDVGRGSGP